MQVGFDFAVDDKIVDFLLHKLLLKAKKVALSSNFFSLKTSWHGKTHPYNAPHAIHRKASNSQSGRAGVYFASGGRVSPPEVWFDIPNPFFWVS